MKFLTGIHYLVSKFLSFFKTNSSFNVGYKTRKCADWKKLAEDPKCFRLAVVQLFYYSQDARQENVRLAHWEIAMSRIHVKSKVSFKKSFKKKFQFFTSCNKYSSPV